MRVGVYPGTFDPITFGHMDIIHRAAGLVDKIIVAVAANAGKEPLFTLSEREKIVKQEIEAGLPVSEAKRVEVTAFHSLLTHFCHKVQAKIIIRGLRAISDFEYEFQMTGMNARLDPGIDTVFLMASEKYQFISSRFVKEISLLGGDVSSFVSHRVANLLQTQFKKKSLENKG
ncbi:MAG: pantetheine-phosphate adenylyltransferase [Alphaproteobacteria bacterium]|nr:pantetheine-phosphate adenylyltransferase [Alphaproteobacteria bacterium]